MPLEFSPSHPAFWLAISLLMAILGSAAARALIPALRRTPRPLLWDVATWMGAAVFVLVFPALAWRHGALSPYYAGIGEIDWVTSLVGGVVLAIGLSAGIIVITLLQGKSASDAPIARPWPLALVTATLLEIHWAFYRQGAVALLAVLGQIELPAWANGLATLGPEDLVYWGGWLSLLILLVEWIAIPGAHRGMTQPEHAPRMVRQLLYAVFSAAIFVLSRNFWLCWLSHMVAEGIIEGRLLRHSAAHTAATA